MTTRKEYKDAYNVYHILRWLVKYGITALTILCTFHSGLLAMGYDLLGVHIMLCVFLFALGIALSRFFHLCWVHQGCVIYTCTVVLFITLKRHGILSALSVDVDIARSVMCVLGIFILGGVLWKMQKKSC